MKKIDLDIQGKISKFGHCLVGVMGEPMYMYTVGLSPANAELIMFANLHPPRFADVMNHLASLSPFRHNQTVPCGGQYPFKVIDADYSITSSEYTLMVEHYRPSPYRVQQVLVCDLNGVYPDDPSCESPYNSVPILRRRLM
jgi:hypothetical protein